MSSEKQSSKYSTVTECIITEREAAAFLSLLDYGLLTAEQIAPFLFPDREPAQALRSTRARISQLSRQGYLHKFTYPARPSIGRIPNLYALAHRGKRALEELDYSAEGYIQPKHRTKPAISMVAHRRAVTDFWIQLAQACEIEKELELMMFIPDWQRHRRGGMSVPIVKDYVPDTKDAIIPDAVFVLENTAKKKRALYYLEVDRGTEPINSIKHASSLSSKLTRLDAYIESGRYAEKWEAHGKFQGMRVVTVFQSETRLENAIDGFQGMKPGLHANYLFTTTQSLLKSGMWGFVWQNRNGQDTGRYNLLGRQE